MNNQTPVPYARSMVWYHFEQLMKTEMRLKGYSDMFLAADCEGRKLDKPYCPGEVLNKIAAEQAQQQRALEPPVIGPQVAPVDPVVISEGEAKMYQTYLISQSRQDTRFLTGYSYLQKSFDPALWTESKTRTPLAHGPPPTREKMHTLWNDFRTLYGSPTSVNLALNTSQLLKIPPFESIDLASNGIFQGTELYQQRADWG